MRHVSEKVIIKVTGHIVYKSYICICGQSLFFFLTFSHCRAVRKSLNASPPPVSTLQVFFKEVSVKQVDVPTLTGAFGILPAHVPTLQVLRPGVVTVFSDDGSSTKYFGKILPYKNRCEWPWVRPEIPKGLYLIYLLIKYMKNFYEYVLIPRKSGISVMVNHSQ